MMIAEVYLSFTNLTQPILGKVYIAKFMFAPNNQAVYKCKASSEGIGWEGFRIVRGNGASKSSRAKKLNFDFLEDIV